MFSARLPTAHYKKVKAAYAGYLQTYKQINNGSLNGALDFFQFYHYITVVCRYSDPRSCRPMGYR
ncbi:MAG: hypothetical protein EBR09_01675 [Proteobacteria bacterium]|nr:hypothetical protein [Pseudomonadota bacterium]